MPWLGNGQVVLRVTEHAASGKIHFLWDLSGPSRQFRRGFSRQALCDTPNFQLPAGKLLLHDGLRHRTPSTPKYRRVSNLGCRREPAPPYAERIILRREETCHSPETVIHPKYSQFLVGLENGPIKRASSPIPVRGVVLTVARSGDCLYAFYPGYA